MKCFQYVFVLILVLVSIPFLSGAGNAELLELDSRVEIRLPILMYHKILNSSKGKYTVNEKQLESDWIALKEAGFEPVFMSEVIKWMDGHGTLPEKPIVITFDDGHYNNLHYGLPIAQKHDMKFMINPVTGFSKFSVEQKDCGNPNYSHLSWTEIKQAVDSGLIEIGNHTHKMHRFKPRFGIMRIGGESDKTYYENLKQDIEEAQQLIIECGVPLPQTFAYPFGKYSKESREILLDMGFRALLTCNEWVNVITKGEPESLHNLGRFNRDGHLSTEQVLKRVTREPLNRK